MLPGEIYLAQFPFGDAPGMKLRPVLLLTGPIGPIPEILVVYISSVIPSQPLPSDMLLDPALPQFRSTHLESRLLGLGHFRARGAGFAEEAARISRQLSSALPEGRPLIGG